MTSSRRPIRVCILQGSFSPNVLPYFALLNQQPDLEVTVWFLSLAHRSRKWDVTIRDQFAWAHVPGWSWQLHDSADALSLEVNPRLVARLLRSNFDVVVLRGWSSPAFLQAQLACLARGIPTILWSGSVPGATAYDPGASGRPTGRRRLVRPLLRWWVRQARTLIAYGTRSKRYLLELGAAERAVFVAWNTVDLAGLAADADARRPERETVRARFGFEPNDTVVLYVGRFEPFKRVDDLIRAYQMVARERSDVGLLLAGYGPEEPQLRQLASEQAGARIAFAGHVPMSDLAAIYTAADLFALPSGDIWGLVVNEAMACGLPVVTSDAVGASDDLVLPGRNGFTYPHGDVPALADRLRQLLDPATRARFGACSRQHIAGYTYEQAVVGATAAIRAAAG